MSHIAAICHIVVHMSHTHILLQYAIYCCNMSYCSRCLHIVAIYHIAVDMLHVVAICHFAVDMLHVVAICHIAVDMSNCGKICFHKMKKIF